MPTIELGGVVRGRSGGILPDVAPSNAYPTADDHDVVIAANADAVFARLAEAMERPDLAAAFASHEARAARQHDLDDEIARWTRTRSAADLIATLQAHEVPVGLINRAPDLLQDPHFAAREMIVRMAAGFARPVPMANVVPKFSRTPGAIRHGGPALGADTEAVLRDVGGCSPAEIVALRDAGVVGCG